MGQSKQLMAWGEETLLSHAVGTALKVSDRVAVVLGAQATAHRTALVQLPVMTVENRQWAEGMGSSMKTGVEFIRQSWPDAEAMVVMVCDQPLITPEHLEHLIATFRNQQVPIVASQYGSTFGVPVLFSKEMFPFLLQIPNTAGAKKMIQGHLGATAMVPFENGKVDVDTPEEYATFVKHVKSK
jgi:molybdenum cofactor cytidylyltransferase